MHDNRIFHNSFTGVNAINNAQIFQNRIYGNRLGINSGLNGGILRNNRIYANTEVGIVTFGTFGGNLTDAVNNTIYQTAGVGILVQNTTSNLHLSNNIIAMESGYALRVTADSETGFTSDYNLFQLGATAKLANWEGHDYVNQVDWFNQIGFDARSQTGEARFADLDGADNILGYDPTPIGPVQIIDNGDPGYATVGPWANSALGYLGDSQTLGLNFGSSANWTFTGLIPGTTYQIATTYPAVNVNNNSAPFSILDGGRALRVARRIRAGQVYINGFGAGGGIELPFGGMKKSGHGREKGLEALLEFSTLKTIVLRHG